MKKEYILGFVAALAVIVSCSKEPSATSELNNAEKIKLNIILSAPEYDGASTKAAKKGWVAGDKLNCWFTNNDWDHNTPDLVITFDGEKWTAGSLRDGATLLSSGGKMLLAYEGYNDLSSYSYSYSTTPEYKPGTVGVSYGPYCVPLTFFSNPNYGVSYTYSENTLTATVTQWQYSTKFKVLIKNNNGNMNNLASNYSLQVHNDTKNSYIQSFGLFSLSRRSDTWWELGSTSGNPYGEGTTGGVQEADGIAFYYTGFSCSAADITFTLKEYTGSSITSTLTYTVTGKTISALQNDRCLGVSLNYSSFN